MPRRSGHPGWMRWSPEDGEGGLRRVLLPRPLVRRKATIKSTHTMWYSPLVKPERKIQRITPIPYKKSKEIRRLQVISSLYCKYTETARRGTGCHGILVPAAQSRDCKPIRNKPCRGQFPRQGLEKIQRMESPPMMVSVTWSVWSRTTMSASMPGARIPFFRCPMILAGVADAIFTAS